MNAQQKTFPGMHTDEVVVLVQRRHWSLLIGRVVRWLLLIALPVAVALVMDATESGPTLDGSTPGSAALLLGVSAYVLIVLMLFFQDWLDYYLDALILSSERIIHIEQRSVFNREVSQLALDRIQDVTIATKGVFSTLLGFGTLTVETAGEQENFVIKHIPDVEKLQSTILMYAKQAPRMGVDHEPDASRGKDVAPPRTPTGLTGRPS